MPTESTEIRDWIFIIVTGFIAYNGITFRDKNGKRDDIRTLFGCIALLFCLAVFAREVLHIW